MLAKRRRKSVVSDALFGGRGTTVADMGCRLGFEDKAKSLTAAVPTELTRTIRR
jgi:hypothetical protein